MVLYCVLTTKHLLILNYYTMSSNNILKFFSLNCAGVTNMIPVLRDICNDHDVLLLQETWLTPDNLEFLNGVHEDFTCHSISAVDLGQPLVGRPFGGLSILWRKSLGIKATLKTFEHNRMLGIQFETNFRRLLIINVYLPYYCLENYDEYLQCLGKIAYEIEDYDHSDVMIMGDFNANVGGPFFREWTALSDDLNMEFVDVSRLTHESYTHINNGSLSKTWLDHCLTTRTVSRSIENIHILYDYFFSDHLPLCVSLNFEQLEVQQEADRAKTRIKWDLDNREKTAEFFYRLRQNIYDDPNQLLCRGEVCHDTVHTSMLETKWRSFVTSVLTTARRVFGTKTGRNQVIPGWNDEVKEYYQVSRQAFLDWRVNGSLRNGAVADNMRLCRARFKLALRRCKAREKEARALAIARKFKEKNMREFWREIKSLNKTIPTLPSRIDDATGNRDICRLWKEKFEGVLNSIADEDSCEELRRRIRNEENTPVQRTTPEEIENIISGLTAGKASGLDDIPCEFYKKASLFLLQWLRDFFNAIMIHQVVPTCITEVVLCPLLKSSLKDPGDSGNYRPIAIATSASKILENIILNRLETYIESSDFQFGFKKEHSTDICVFALKDIVNYYRELNTPVFLCFIDIKSAYDLVSYQKLFCILCDRGVPKYLILLLLSWYTTQKLVVRWGGTLSDSFGMANGIRQGSCLSPHLFNVYVDQLNYQLRNSGVGCHIANKCVNNLSYADDMVLLTPDAKSLNELLKICEEFAREYHITYSIMKTEAMLILPRGTKLDNPPLIYLNGCVIGYVDRFRYLGHIITSSFTDDEDIAREIRNLYVRGNTIIRKFGFLNLDTKRTLFKSYCYSLYTCSLWSKYCQASLNKLKVAYNDIMRQLVGVPRWHSARTVFVENNIRSFFENVRAVSYSLMSRVVCCSNSLIQALLRSDCYTMSRTRENWFKILYVYIQNLSLL